MTIAIDFDGTCTTHEYPNIGKEIGAITVLKDLVDNGHKLILFTMRHGDELVAAQDWFEQNGIKLYGSQYNPSQRFWTKSNKCYAEMYIDDAALGCPLLNNPEISDRDFVDWTKVREILTEKGLFNKK
jgi:hypothetical protein